MVEKNNGFQIFAHAVMILLALCCLIPFLLLLMSSITDENALIANGYSFFPEKFSRKPTALSCRTPVPSCMPTACPFWSPLWAPCST